ncbi:hypothetical protein [Microbacterium sp. ZW T5_56]|uniref:hypothetical protein n=1 Tax=Microbacterium sp. ZW T5_56 TaxID=3378081 RepID=UPI00385206BC
MIAAEPRTTPIRTHEHGWVTESRHRTSEGIVVYVRCVDCDARRVDVLRLAPITRADSVTGTAAATGTGAATHAVISPDVAPVALSTVVSG